ncbi:MAG TPA: PQQ-dependent sugar dehydrogenase [Candidatus Limnocylindrales bacterium]
MTLPARLPIPTLPRRLAVAAAILLAIAAVAPTTVAAARRPVTPAAVPIHPAVGISLQQVATALTRPVLFTNGGDGTNYWYVVEQAGIIRVKDGDNPGDPWETFLDIRDIVNDSGNEMGLLGLAFHPSYETNGKFYVNYTDVNGNTVVRLFHRSASNDKRATRTASLGILAVSQPYSNHNGGNLAFAGGYLYIGMGDGGSSGDPGNRAQNVNSLLGKLLRININGTSGSRHYLIPPGNPYIGRAGRDEIWARGLRNPWRWSFDRATGDLWIGDVGQNRYEEIDKAVKPASGPAGRGLNYGWRVMEGRHCYAPSSGCSTSGKTRPLIEYSHASGNCSVTGGFVYRGPDALLRGRYLYGDYCSGRIWTVGYRATAPATPVLLQNTDLLITSFGEDEAGRVYVVDHGGRIFRIVGT